MQYVGDARGQELRQDVELREEIPASLASQVRVPRPDALAFRSGSNTSLFIRCIRRSAGEKKDWRLSQH